MRILEYIFSKEMADNNFKTGIKNKYVLFSVISLIVSIVFLTIGDGTNRGAETTGISYLVLFYFHGITWLLLSIFFILKSKAHKSADLFGYLALVVYLIFLAILFLG
jgi:heme O synthase-like polyprenyltransferase